MNNSVPQPHTDTQNKAHLVHITYGLDVGGLERVLINCINGLPNYKHSIIVLTQYSEKFKGLLPKDIEVIALRKSDGHSWKIYQDVYQLLKKMKPQVVHSYNIATLEYQICAFLAGAKVRLHAEHGRDSYDPDGSNKKYQWLRRLISPVITRFIAVSDDLFQWLKDDVGIAKAKARLIYNGVNTEHYTANTKITLHPKQTNKFVFGSVGRLAAIKNQDMLIRAFAFASQQSTSFKNGCNLSLVGGGEKALELATLVAELDIEESVWLAGERMDMSDVYKSFDTFVLSSIAEGVPMTMLEAMSTSLPVLSTKVGGIPEIVIDNESGWLIDSQDYQTFGNAMISIFEGANTNAFGETARTTIENGYSEHAMISAYNSEYQQGQH